MDIYKQITLLDAQRCLWFFFLYIHISSIFYPPFFIQIDRLFIYLFFSFIY